MDNPPAPEVHERRPNNRLPIERGVFIEICVFEGNRSLLNYLWDFLKRDHRAPFFAVDLIEEHGAGSVINLCGFYDFSVLEELCRRNGFHNVKCIPHSCEGKGADESGKDREKPRGEELFNMTAYFSHSHMNTVVELLLKIKTPRERRGEF